MSGLLRRSTILEGGFILAVLVLVSVLSVAGVGLATEILPFWAGATLGYAVAHLATASGVSSRVQLPMLAVAALALVAFALIAVAGPLGGLLGIEIPPWLELGALDISSPLGGSTPVGKFLFGLLVAVAGELVARGALPGMFGDSVAEAGAEGKEMLRGAKIFLVAALLVLTPVALLVGFVAVLVWIAANFA